MSPRTRRSAAAAAPSPPHAHRRATAARPPPAPPPPLRYLSRRPRHVRTHRLRHRSAAAAAQGSADRAATTASPAISERTHRLPVIPERPPPPPQLAAPALRRPRPHAAAARRPRRVRTHRLRRRPRSPPRRIKPKKQDPFSPRHHLRRIRGRRQVLSRAKDNDQDQKRPSALIDAAALQQIVAAILPTILQSLTVCEPDRRSQRNDHDHHRGRSYSNPSSRSNLVTTGRAQYSFLFHDRRAQEPPQRHTEVQWQRRRFETETFILKVDNYFRAANISDAVEVNVVVGKLVGDTAIFWLKHNKTH
ncbi:MAG: hypothetical protein BJ554DRAFT_4456, partial [Olpidium bornovanus]